MSVLLNPNAFKRNLMCRDQRQHTMHLHQCDNMQIGQIMLHLEIQRPLFSARSTPHKHQSSAEARMAALTEPEHIETLFKVPRAKATLNSFEFARCDVRSRETCFMKRCICPSLSREGYSRHTLNAISRHLRTKVFI